MSETEILGLLWCLHATIEWWLGRTNRVAAKSVVDLLWNCLMWIVKWRRKSMVIDVTNVKRAKELDDVLVLLDDFVAGIVAGKGVGVLRDLVSEITGAFNGLEMVPGEYQADKRAFLETIGRHMGTQSAFLISWVETKAGMK